ncbi:ABC transporter permease [Flavitalea flava]
MFQSYLKVGMRNILKHKVFSFINLFGLAAAMAVCMLIVLMVADQKSYDQFNTNKQSLYRILTDKPDFRHPYATSPYPMAGAIRANDPVIKDVTQLIMGVGGDGIGGGRLSENGVTGDRLNSGGLSGQHSVEMRGYFASPSLFNLFSFELGKGNKEEALAAPGSMVITSETARRLFKEEDPIGKTIEFTDRGLTFFDQGESSAPVKWGVYTITGVLADKPYKSHLKFDVLISASSMETLIKAKKIDDIRQRYLFFSGGGGSTGFPYEPRSGPDSAPGIAEPAGTL